MKSGGKIVLVITRSEQLSRASVAAAFAVVSAAVSHTVAGGEAPSLIAFFASFWLALLASLPLVGKSTSLLRISATVLIGQAVLHSLYAFFPATSSIASTSVTDQMLGHNHTVTSLTLPEMATLEQVAPGIAMIAAHVLAAIASIAVLRHADRALAAVRSFRWFVLAAFETLVPVALTPVTVRHAIVELPALRPTDVFLSVIQRRGPPRSALSV